jgi:acyl-CoA synthetase (AMP-forming)/AMP-acid ligase II
VNFQSTVEAVAYWAAHTPDKVCLIEAKSGKQCTYAELWRYSRIVAAKLQAAGLQRGERVLVVSSQTIECVAAILGLQLTGGVLVPTSHDIGIDRVREIAEYTDAEVYIAEKQLDIGRKYIDMAQILNGEPLENVVFPTAEELAMIAFTTGTTGKAKGVMRQYITISVVADNLGDVFNLGADDVVLLLSPVGLEFGVNRVSLTLFCGACFVITNGILFANEVYNNIEVYGVTVLLAVASHYRMLLNNAKKLSDKCTLQIRIIYLAGESAGQNLISRLCETFPKSLIFNCYGMTEAPTTTYCNCREYGNKLFCVGKTFKNTEVFFVNERGSPVEHISPNKLGIIAIKNAAMSLGYWKDTELTASVFSEDYLITSDLGYRDDKGLIYVVGRRDDVIISGGRNIAPYEIEEAALKMHSVKECACIGVPDKVLGYVPKLFVVTNDNAEFSQKTTIDFLKTKLEVDKLPRFIEEIEVIPRIGERNKIDRKALKILEVN